MLVYLLLATSKVLFPHLEGNTSLYSTGDPGLLLVNVRYPDRPLTLFDYVKKDQNVLPVGLHGVDDDVLRFQVWHTYYGGSRKSFWLELEFDQNIKVGPGGNMLQGTRGKMGSPSMNAVMINDRYFKIVSGGLCLEVETTKSVYRDAYPLKFRRCADVDLQTFAFVSKMKALCVLQNELCPNDKDDVYAAEAIALKRLLHFASDPSASNARLYSEKINEITYFLDKEIHILFSAYMHMQLAEKTESGEIGGVNRLVDAKEFKYDDRVVITKNGSGYEIKIGSSKICRNRTDVVKCQDGNTVWNIERKTFGFNIAQDGLCITQIDKDTLKLRRCTGSDDQLFTFKISGGRDRCEDSLLAEDGGAEKKMVIPDIHIYPVTDEHVISHEESIHAPEYIATSSSELSDYIVLDGTEPRPNVRRHKKGPLLVHENATRDRAFQCRKVIRGREAVHEHSDSHDVHPRCRVKRFREVPVARESRMDDDVLPKHKVVSQPRASRSQPEYRVEDVSDKTVQISLGSRDKGMDLHLYDDLYLPSEVSLLQDAPYRRAVQHRHTKHRHGSENVYLEKGIRNTDKFLFK
ncbi:UNVERIFIED_CONTAM: hypothetical protein PYX00_011547 [Menopon gallinae]|uniref:Ricin B-type lectin domain-containing protein n=1 Tax=Menopon gallinae TaxID=328185 RepID=A0AAW2H7S3_9NEOP